MSEKPSIESRLAVNGFAPRTRICQTDRLEFDIADLTPPAQPIDWLAMMTIEGRTMVKVTSSEVAQDRQGRALPDLVGFGIFEHRRYVRWYIGVDDDEHTTLYVQIITPGEPLSRPEDIAIDPVK